MDAPARALLDLLAGQNPPPSIAIAYSGGRDSSVLLHAAAGLQRAGRTGPLRALHVDHGLHPDAPRWRDHCAAHCTRLGVAFDTVSVDARPASGESPEAAARTARYTALAGLLRPGEWLLTAHHRDDQAETLLLQLLRGAGIAGLAAMPARTPFAGGWLARPLLDLGRNDLAAYAARHALEWCEDPGNAAVEHDRNYLRHAVLPRLEERWPAVAQCLGRSAAHCAEAAGLLDELAAGDLAAAGVLPGTSTLPLTALRALPSARRRLLLRHWLAGLGLPLPGRRVLARVETEMLGAAPDRNPCIAWPGAELRRYRDLLHARRPPPARQAGPGRRHRPRAPRGGRGDRHHPRRWGALAASGPADAPAQEAPPGGGGAAVAPHAPAAGVGERNARGGRRPVGRGRIRSGSGRSGPQPRVAGPRRHAGGRSERSRLSRTGRSVTIACVLSRRAGVR
jgi:tRNA(Ile)-lysidine synthase